MERYKKFATGGVFGFPFLKTDHKISEFLNQQIPVFRLLNFKISKTQPLINYEVGKNEISTLLLLIGDPGVQSHGSGYCIKDWKTTQCNRAGAGAGFEESNLYPFGNLIRNSNPPPCLFLTVIVPL